MPCPTEVWASAATATITTPSAAAQQQGFSCGPADPGIFNWLFNSLTECIIDAQTRIAALEANSAGGGSSGSFGTGTIVGDTTTPVGGTGSFGTGTIA